MRNKWVQFGCFLTGYNYNILRNCSEAAFKSVKKYTAAMIIVCILWFFIGFTFAQRYLSSGILGGTLAGGISVVIIIQIEKQIILSINPGKMLLIFRTCLALMMAVLGSVIIDQILLAKDIEVEKVSYVSNKVDSLLPKKTAELMSQILGLDTSIAAKEREKQQYVDEVAKHPVIPFITSQTQTIHTPVKYTDRSGKDSIVTETKSQVSVSKNYVPNPKSALIPSIDTNISEMQKQKTAKQNMLLNIRPDLEKELKEKAGFLDELKVMVQLISNSYVALSFWLLWILFFLFIEMLVLFSKMGDKSSDYEKAVLHHMNLQIWRLDALAKELSSEKTTRQ